jgi:hypothetical protein
MAVYCPDCGNVLKTGESAAGGADCSRCKRPLGDPNWVDREAATEKGFRLLFVDSLPLAIVAVLAGLILLTLAVCVLFPVHAQHGLAALGLTTDGAVRFLGIHMQGFEWLMLAAGAAAILLFFRLPARQRAKGRL